MEGFGSYYFLMCFISVFDVVVMSVTVFPQTVCPHYGVLTVRERSGVLEVSFRNRGFRLRRLAQSSVCVDSVARNGCRGILGRFTGCPCTFWSKTWFYVTGAGDRMVLEDGSVSLRGRCKESDTL